MLQEGYRPKGYRPKGRGQKEEAKNYGDKNDIPKCREREEKAAAYHKRRTLAIRQNSEPGSGEQKGYRGCHRANGCQS
jgi:hypothetical protein